MNKKLKIGITGGNGLLGKRLIESLDKLGHTIYATFRSEHHTLNTRSTTWLQGDVLDISFMELFVEKVDIVIHCAAVVSFKKKDQALLYKTNVEGTSNVVNCLLDYPDKKLIHISSIAALGRRFDQEIDENCDWNEELPHSDYAKSKMLAEMEVHRGIAENLDAMLLLPSVILAFDETERSSADIWSQIKHAPTLAPQGGNGFVDIEDVVQAVQNCLTHWQPNGRFIISGHNLLFRDLYATFLDKPVSKIKGIPPSLLMVVFPFLKLYYFLINKETTVSLEAIRSSAEIYSYDNSKSRTALHVTYKPIHETMKRIRQKQNAKSL